MAPNEPIMLERTFQAPIDKVWQALTDRNQMQKWYFDLAEFKAEPGFEFQFEGGDEKQTFLHLCKVTEVIPRQKLAYTWRYDGYAGNTLLTFELFPAGENTRLKLTHAGFETFPADIRAFDSANFVQGWNHIIGVSLRDFLENETVQNRQKN